MKVMIVDDQAPMRSLIREALRVPDADVVECATGTEAVARYLETLPDWVAMDCRMEPMDGITAAARIRALHPQARIVIVTNWDEPELRAAAHAVGAEDYVLKDDLERLPQVIGRPFPQP